MILKGLRSQIVLFSVLLSILWCGLGRNVLLAMPPVDRMVLPNGLVLLVSEERSLPLVTIHLLIDAGSRKDPPEQGGLAYLTARGLLLGTPEHTAAAINEEMDFMGASITASAGRDYMTVTMQILSKDLDRGLDLLLEVLTESLFPEQEIRRETQKTLAAIQSAEERPMEVARKAFRKTLFVSSPYAHPVEGTKESLPRITRDMLVRFYKTYYRSNNAILAIVGDVSRDKIKAKLIPELTKWSMGRIPKEHFTETFAKGPKTENIHRDITQANIVIGSRGVSRGNPDYYALTVMNYIFGGGGFGSRLLEEIRVKRGLAYSVASYFDPGKYPGSFQIVLQTKNSSAREAISLALAQMKKIRRGLVSQKEMDRAQKYLIGSFPLRLDTQGELARFLARVEYYGLGLDYPEKYRSHIQSISREEVLRVAMSYLHPDDYVLVVVANLQEAGIN